MHALAASLLAIGLVALPVPALAADEDATIERKRYDDTRRFYLYVDSGNAFQLHDGFGGDARLDSPSNVNYVLGGGGGYNFTRHWGFEIQGHGTEPDVRSRSRGKIEELSNITLIPAVRFRYPLLGDRLVPYVTAGVGWSMSDINDTGDLKVKVEMDEQSIAGSVGAGIEYFVAPNVAFGVSAASYIYPEADTHIVIRDDANRVTSESRGSVDLTSVALLAHVRLFLGEPASPEEGSWRDLGRLLYARNGPFDTDDVRFYLYSLTGHTFLVDDDFGGGIAMESPGDFNATLGGGLGVNLTRHWGGEIDLLNSEPNLDGGAVGKFIELSNFLVVPAVRYRYAVADRRVVLSAKAGVGAAFYNLNDARETADVFRVVRGVQTPRVDMDDASVAGMVAVGVEYFLNHNISVGVSVPYFIYPDVDTVVQRREQRPFPPAVHTHVNPSGVGVLLMIRAYVP